MKALQRRLGLGAVVAISLSAMLGSGIFVLPGLAIEFAGPYAWLAYLLSAVCVLPATMSKSELATAMPSSGGTYVYLDRTFGPFIGTISGFGLWLSLLLKCAFALVGLSAYLSVMTDVPIIPTSLMFLGLITLINILGVGKVSSALKIIVIITITGLLFLFFYGVFQVDAYLFSTTPQIKLDGLFSATALVFVSFAGVTKVAAIAEEIINPEENLPKGIIISLVIVTLLYCSITFTLTYNLPFEMYYGDLKPIHTLAQHLGGNYFGLFAAALGVLTMASMANAGILAASRFPFAMGRDSLLPSFIGRLSQKFLTPVASIIFSGVITAVAIVLLDVAKIAKYASVFMIIIYMSESIAVIVLREARVQWYSPTFKSPLYPWIQIFGIISSIALLFYMDDLVVKAIAVIVFPAIFLYFFYSRHRATRKGVIGIRGRRKDLIEDKSISFPFVDLESLEISGDAPVVVTLFGTERSPEMLVEMGVALLGERNNIEVAYITEFPEQTDLHDIKEDSPHCRSLRRRVLFLGERQNKEVHFDSVGSHDIYKTIYEIGQRFHCEWMLTEWGGRTRGAFTFHNPMGWLRDHLSCNLITFRDRGVRYVQRIMVYIENRTIDKFIIQTADHLSQVMDAHLTLVSWAKNEKEKSEVFDHLTELRSFAKSITDVGILSGKTKTEAILSATIEFDLLVFGVGLNDFRHITIIGNDHDRIMAKSECSVVSVRPSREHF